MSSIFFVACGSDNDNAEVSENKFEIVISSTDLKECGPSGDGFVCEEGNCWSESGLVLAEGKCEESKDFDVVQYETPIDNSWGIARLRELALSMKPDETIHAHAVVRDIPFDFNAFKNVSEVKKLELLQERKVLLEPSQSRVERLLENIGGRANRRTWLVPGQYRDSCQFR